MRPASLLPAALLSIAAVVQAWAYWPGLMTWDAVRQYGQAVDGDYDDWHPPAMEWLWRQLIPIHAGPAPMLLLQLALYWGGFALLAGVALRDRRPGLASTLAACALLPLPLALMGAVLKDCLMAGALLFATGLLAWSRPGERRGWALRGIAIALLCFAATLRFNAFLACMPLLVALLPARWSVTPVRYAVTALIGSGMLMCAMPIANRMIGAERSGVELSLIIFDMGGITEFSGVDAFPPMAGVRDPVAVNHRCYRADKWDSYSWWVDPLCPIRFESVRAAFQVHGQSPYGAWIAAIAAHPIAYAEHRLRHFNIHARFLVNAEVERPVQKETVPNPWGYAERPSVALTALDDFARASAVTPLGWPIWWTALALGVLVLGRDLPSRRIIVPLALSALLYGLGYLAFSVASELRYHLWTMAAALIAAVLTVAERREWVKGRLAWAVAPVMCVTLLGTFWRLAM